MYSLCTSAFLSMCLWNRLHPWSRWLHSLYTLTQRKTELHQRVIFHCLTMKFRADSAGCRSMSLQWVSAGGREKDSQADVSSHPAGILTLWGATSELKSKTSQAGMFRFVKKHRFQILPVRRHFVHFFQVSMKPDFDSQVFHLEHEHTSFRGYFSNSREGKMF